MKQWILGLIYLFAQCIYGETPIQLKIVEEQIVVNGKPATVYAILQPDETMGVTFEKGQNFDVMLENDLAIPASVHWHGLILPNQEDGAAYITQFPIFPSLKYHYEFPILQAGTFWMHSHFSFETQKLLSAPLILKDPDEKPLANQDVVLFLADFSFKAPAEIFRDLQCGPKKMEMGKPDIADVAYDAFLANRRTLEDPELISVKGGSSVRLRIINGSAMTNFFLSVGKLKAEAIAVDGNRIQPLQGARFELAVAQRIDLIVKIPKEGGSFPILAQGAGTNMQTGVVLMTQSGPILQLTSKALNSAGALTNTMEKQYSPLFPLEMKKVDRKFDLNLEGNMQAYIWTINGQVWPNITPLVVNEGERVEIRFNNKTMMAHPMHLHGHTFQITEIDGKPINGAMRDTINVPGKSSVTIQFDADQPGVWPLHCHMLYHEAGGMMTVLRYNGFVQPL